MNTLTVEVEMPRNIISVLDVSQRELPKILQQLVTLELFREGYISAGKGAEILGMSRWRFIQLLAEHEIDYIELSDKELAEDAATAEQFMTQIAS